MRITLIMMLLIASQNLKAGEPTHCAATFDELENMLGEIWPKFVEFKNMQEKVYGKLNSVQFSTGKAITEDETFEFPWPIELDNQSVYSSDTDTIYHFCLNETHENWGCTIKISSGQTECFLSEVRAELD